MPYFILIVTKGDYIRPGRLLDCSNASVACLVCLANASPRHVPSPASTPTSGKAIGVAHAKRSHARRGSQECSAVGPAGGSGTASSLFLVDVSCQQRRFTLTRSEALASHTGHSSTPAAHTQRSAGCALKPETPISHVNPTHPHMLAAEA